MLNRLKVSQRLSLVAERLFPDVQQVSQLAQRLWGELSKDETFAERAKEAGCSFLVPGWNGKLADVHHIGTRLDTYTVIAVDGSQIYPDRHLAGAGCFLINIGGVILRYGKQASATFFSEPRVCLPEEFTQIEKHFSFSPDIVDLLREQDELAYAVQKVKEVQADGVTPVVLIDGSIVFWPLEGKPPEIRAYFLKEYLRYLILLYEKRVPVAGYISLPKSRELVSLVKLGLCRYAVANCIPCHSMYTTFPCKVVDPLVDTQIARGFLPKHHRTTLFSSASKIIQEYPEPVQPWFCYLDVGKEIVRLEIPAWIADDADVLKTICQVAIDQSEKGRGYPVCLAEAHEQAVVKGPDREFFYHLIYKIGFEGNKHLSTSQKSIKKRGIGV